MSTPIPNCSLAEGTWQLLPDDSLVESAAALPGCGWSDPTDTVQLFQTYWDYGQGPGWYLRITVNTIPTYYWCSAENWNCNGGNVMTRGAFYVACSWPATLTVNLCSEIGEGSAGSGGELSESEGSGSGSGSGSEEEGSGSGGCNYFVLVDGLLPGGSWNPSLLNGTCYELTWTTANVQFPSGNWQCITTYPAGYLAPGAVVFNVILAYGSPTDGFPGWSVWLSGSSPDGSISYGSQHYWPQSPSSNFDDASGTYPPGTAGNVGFGKNAGLCTVNKCECGSEQVGSYGGSTPGSSCESAMQVFFGHNYSSSQQTTGDDWWAFWAEADQEYHVVFSTTDTDFPSFLVYEGPCNNLQSLGALTASGCLVFTPSVSGWVYLVATANDTMTYSFSVNEGPCP